MPVITIQILEQKMWMGVSKDRAEKLQSVVGKTMSFEKFNELCTIPAEFLDAEDLNLEAN